MGPTDQSTAALLTVRRESCSRVHSLNTAPRVVRAAEAVGMRALEISHPTYWPKFRRLIQILRLDSALNWSRRRWESAMCMIGVAVHPRQIPRKALHLLPSVFMEISDLYAYGGSGTPGIGRDHALKLVKKYPDGSFDAVSQDIGHAPHLIHMPYTGRGGEGDASSYFAIFNKSGPAGGNIELFGRKVPINDVKNSVLKEEHLQGRGFPSLGGVPPNAPGTPSGMRATTGWYDRLPGAAREVVGPAMPAAKGIDPHLSGGPITIYDYTGGTTTVTMNNVHTAQ